MLSTLFCLPDNAPDAATNMAVDLSMLRTLPDHPDAVGFFRAYGWGKAAFTFGQAQRWRDIEAHMPETGAGNGSRPARIRRPTGGGIVDHRRDWTYALALPARGESGAEKPADLYARVHRLLAHALAEIGVRSRMVECPPPGECPSDPVSPVSAVDNRPGICFRDPVPGDLLEADSGAKVAGAAMKRSREGILLQGSVLTAVALDAARRERLRGAFIEKLRRNLNARAAAFDLPSERTLAPLRELFESDAWNRRR